MAERQGFEPWEGCPSTVFKTVAFDHSATSPGLLVNNTQKPAKNTIKSHSTKENYLCIAKKLLFKIELSQITPVYLGFLP